MRGFDEKWLDEYRAKQQLKHATLTDVAPDINVATKTQPVKNNDKRRGINKTEQRYADECLYDKDHWYEAITLKWPDGTRYTPDFMVRDGGSTILFLEIKGPYIHSRDSKIRFLRARADFPMFRFQAWQMQTPGEWVEIWKEK